MSARRFVAYFFAIAAGSTFTFASTLRGQPVPPGEVAPEIAMQEVAVQKAAMQRAAMREARREAGMLLAASASRPSHQRWNHHRE